MKHLKSFNEELNYLDSLKMQSKAREDWETSKEEEMQKIGQEKSAKHKAEINKYSSVRPTDEIVEERRMLAHRTIQGILSTEQGKTDFREKLISLLNEYGF
jgi:hypothetical protein